MQLNVFVARKREDAETSDAAVRRWNGNACRMQDHMVLLVRSAEERIAHFLLEISRRNGNSLSVTLQMSRQDITDYMGITIETVSRTLTHFEKAGLISLRSSRQIDLCKRDALARLNA